MRMSELHSKILEASRHVPLLEEPAPPQQQTATLRDKIAIAAMQSLLLRDDWKGVPVANIAQAAYIHADEMLFAREAKNDRP